MIVVVEPHPDDAFLSLGWHLEKLWAKWERLIITVYTDDKRAKEAQEYATTIGASSLILGLRESKMSSQGSVKPVPELVSALSTLDYQRVVFPLGLQHPDHLRVASTKVANRYFYLDTPYLSKLKLASDLSRLTRSRRVSSMCFPPKRKWRHKQIFKSQSKFFHFNPLENFHLPEIILK